MILSRDELHARIDDLEDLFCDIEPEIEPDDAQDIIEELHSLQWLKELYYLEDEGFIIIGKDGRCHPVEDACQLNL